MSYDRAELEKIIRTGGTLPDELLNIFKKNAERRRSEKADARLRKLTQYALDVGKARASSSWTPGLQRLRRNRPGFLSPNPVPAGDPPTPLTCDPGFSMIGNTFAPFSWGSPGMPEYGQVIPDQPGAHQSSTMTRPQTGEFSLALVVMSDPNSQYAPVTNEGLGFKGVDISATIGQLYVVAGQSPLVVQGQAQLAMNVPLWFASRFWPGDAYAVSGGFATITVSEFAMDWTLHGIQSKQFGQNSVETDLFGWGAAPVTPGADPNDAVFSNDVYFTPGPLDLSIPLAHNNDAMYAMVEVDIDIFGFVQMGAPNRLDQAAKIYLDYRIADDDDLIVGPEDESDPEYGALPLPSPIILTETRLCGFYPKP